MPTNFMTEGNVLLTGVSFTGAEGAAGSTISWTGLSDPDDAVADIVDQDDDGRLDAGVDTFADPGVTFTGYTYTGIDGVEYPIFTDGGGNYAIIVPNATTQTVVPSSGTSNTFQAETADSGVYLCFGEGTEIATPEGARKVETLDLGDKIIASDGRPVSVKWIWKQAVSTIFGPAERLRPVRVRCGALGNGLPTRDLVLTADHALLIEGLLINASVLVNDTTIHWVPLSELGTSFNVYHIETENHDIVLAEGVETETYIDYVGRSAFDNYEDYIAIYGHEETIAELPYLRVSSRRLLPASLKARLAIAA
ncbi:MAG: hypothetical protein GYB50_25775 [Rhodobacteraceae bacterium]|uniref:Hint domain-containing protein n=1 Tax=Salipiger thiooxidans TaxID=282683 RepID=UPI001A8CCCA0|nr:Hint domain-containing protein [Salipiger thiooxidans]MBN8190318.1 Hint domain-containing protein [Salipiger thiooxidans]MBR9841262.1 hypothetical protein [Paracoccaceae bacterium]